MTNLKDLGIGQVMYVNFYQDRVTYRNTLSKCSETAELTKIEHNYVPINSDIPAYIVMATRSNFSTTLLNSCP